jgi:hypothetical protein
LKLPRALEQRRGKPHRHEEAHKLPSPARCHVDADDPAVGRDGRAAAHAGVERAGEMDALAVAVFDQTVEGAFHDGEAEIERIAHRIQPFAAGQIARHRPLVEGEERRVMLVETDNRQVVRQVDPEQ